MPRRELLTPAQREQLLSFPADAAELIRLYTLSDTDKAFIKAHRGVHNRLGVAVQLAYLRFPGRPMARGEEPHPQVLAMMAAQLKATTSVWALYAQRDETRREHVATVTKWLGLRTLDLHEHRSLSYWLLGVAMQTTQGMVLAQALVAEMRRRQVVLPVIGTIERLCAEVYTRAQRRIFKLLTSPLTPAQLEQLDGLLEIHGGGPITTLTWLRQPPGKPSARSIIAHIARLKAVRALGLPAELGRDVNCGRLLRMAREGAQSAVYQLKDHEPLRRRATLVTAPVAGTVQQLAVHTAGARPVLMQMCGWLAAKHAGAFGFRFRWIHDSMRAKDAGEGGEVVIRSAESLRDLEHFMRLLAEHLAKLELLAPVGELQIDAVGVEAFTEQSASLLPESQGSGESLYLVLERIAARLGPQSVLQPVLVDDHRMEWMTHWTPLAKRKKRATPPVPEQPEPTFVLEAPLELAVINDRPHYEGPLTLLIGPDRVEGGWWDRLPGIAATRNVIRDYWIAQSDNAGVLSIFNTQGTDGRIAWFLHGHFA